ncbi:MAG: type II secretion system protein [Candidatus Eremiobacteraeota bacterium]|nr:type II secretion system protein [Candidatus Eremiobacteraeota bacterium]
MKKEKGFTLTETIVAFALVLIAALVILTSFSSGRKGLQKSEQRVHAAYLGKSLLDSMRSGGFDSIVPSSGTMVFRGINNGAPYSESFSYSTFVQSVDADKKLLWAEITWKDSTGTRKLVMETIIVRKGAG